MSEFPRPLGGGLVLRVVQTDADAEKVAILNGQVHGAGEEEIVRHWLLHGHPTMSRGDWLFIEDAETGQVAATLCLMVTMWSYHGTPLPVAELGFVGTHPDCRGRGLQRTLSDAFDQLALIRGYALAAIEGIPGFYGKFGYEYAVPLLGGANIAYEQIPAMEPAEGDLSLRSAVWDDVPALQVLYENSIATLDLAATRSAELWRYQLSVPTQLGFYPPVELIEYAGQVVGYFRWTDDDWTDRLRIVELAVQAGPTASACILLALRHALEKGQQAGKRGVALQLPANHAAVKYARYLGAIDTPCYGWQVKVLNTVGFLRAIGPALEQRLAASLLSGYSGALVFGLYGESQLLALRFQNGLLTAVDPCDDLEPDARMTQKQAAQLWLGWRGREALENWYPDFRTRETARQLIDVLFPGARAYIYMPY